MNNNYKKNKGFTLAELMIVFAIIAVVVVISTKISKSRSNYETSFMTYSAFMNLKHAIGEIVADGWKNAGGVSQTGIPDIWDSTTSPRFGFCQRLADSNVTGCANCGVFNTVGTVDCTKTATDATDFSSAATTPMFTLTNGQRFFHDSTNTTSPYTIYVDINGKKGTKTDTLNKDVLKFIVNSDGSVFPMHTATVADQNAADNLNYMTASVRYIDSSGNMIVVDSRVSFYTATCDATNNYPNFADCSVGSPSTYDNNCDPSLTPKRTCEVVINKPGF